METIKLLELIAVAVPGTMTGDETHQESNFGALLEPKLRKVFYDEYKELPEQFSKIYHVKTSKKAKETDYGLGAFRQWTKFGNSNSKITGADKMPSVEYQTISAGVEKVYIHEEFASGFAVERKFVDDEQYDVIMKLPKDLARAGRYKVEEDAASLFNDALSPSPKLKPYNNGDTGKAEMLFSKTHSLIDSTKKCSNLIEGTLNQNTLKDALILSKKQLDEAGKLIVMNFDRLVVPPELEHMARVLIQSDAVPGSSNNDINTLKGRLEIVVWDFLTGTNACFLQASKDHEANFFWRKKPEFNREKDFDTFVQKFNGYMRYSYGISDWRGFIAIKPVSATGGN